MNEAPVIDRDAAAALIEPLTDLVIRAGHAILAVNRSAMKVDGKKDGSPVTEADLAADRIIGDPGTVTEGMEFDIHDNRSLYGSVFRNRRSVVSQGFRVEQQFVRFDKDENVWLGMQFQGGIAKFDRRSKTFQTWSLPPDRNGATVF